MSKKITIPEVDIEIGNDLYVRIKEVSYTPGAPEVRYYKDGSGSPADSPEIDWVESMLVIKKFEYIPKPSFNGRTTKVLKDEYDFSVDEEFANNYYDAILEATEEILNEN